MIREGNFLADIPTFLRREQATSLVTAANVRIERIVSTGHSSPEGFWYDQDENEWIMVVEGWGVLEYEDGSSVEMKKGDWLHLPARLRHRVRETSPDEPTVWLAVFYT